MKAMIVVTLLSMLFFSWSAVTAFDKAEAGWRKLDDRQAQLEKAAGF